jgi:TRAP-type C4-dicarboxylate transport system permease small subunit
LSPDDVPNIPTGSADDTTLGIVNGFYMVAGFTAVLIIIIAGYIYTTSSGNPEKTKKAGQAIFYAAIGLVVMLAAFLITEFVIDGIIDGAPEVEPTEEG